MVIGLLGTATVGVTFVTSTVSPVAGASSVTGFFAVALFRNSGPPAEDRAAPGGAVAAEGAVGAAAAAGT
jgi:hypothetical protein